MALSTVIFTIYIHFFLSFEYFEMILRNKSDRTEYLIHY